MVTHVLAAMREAEIRTEVGQIPKAVIDFKEGTTIANTDDVSITTNRTSNGSTASEVVFTGDIEQTDLGDESKAQSKTNLSEIDNIKPSGTFTDYTWANLIYKIVIDECSVLTFSEIGWENHYRGLYDWKNDSPGDDPSGFTVSEPAGSDVQIVASISNHNNPCRLTQTTSQCNITHTVTLPNYGTLEFYIETTDITKRVAGNLTDNNKTAGISIDGSNFRAIDLTIIGGITPVNDTLYHVRIDYETTGGGYKGLVIDTYDVYIDNINYGNYSMIAGGADLIRFQTAENGAQFYVDAIGHTYHTNYDIGQNYNWDIEDMIKLPSEPEYPAQDFILGGDKTIRNYIDQYCDYNYKGWYVNPSNELMVNDLDVDSGFDISTSTKTWSRKAVKQISQIDKVILLCGYVSGSRIEVTSGAGNNVFKDVYAHITDTDLAQTTADNLVTSKSSNPVRVDLWLYDSAKGMFQVGETMTINAGIKIENSSTDVPTGQYIIKSIEFNVITNESHLILEDGLIFTKEVSQPEENSQLIEQVATIANDALQNLVEDVTPQLGGDLDLNGNNIDFPTTANISDCLDEDNMVSDSATKLATQQSIKAYVDAYTLDNAFDAGKTIDGANSEANAVQFGDGTNVIKIWTEDNHIVLKFDVTNDTYLEGLEFRVYDGSNTGYQYFSLRDSTNEICIYPEAAGTGYHGRRPNGASSVVNHQWRVVAATDFVDVTPFPRRSCLHRLNKMKKDINGQIDHSSMPKEFWDIDDEGVEIKEQRSLGVNISYNTKSIQELFNLIAGMKNEIDNLKIQLENKK